MNIPLDRLYHFIEQTIKKIAGDLVVIYRFWPHGEKNINNLTPLKPFDNWLDKETSIKIWCHDQEPLDYDYYKDVKFEFSHIRQFTQIQQKLGIHKTLTNINYETGIFSKSLLIHSEKRSKNVLKYSTPPTEPRQTWLVPVYYWSHALIARDWFRYARHESFKKNISKNFLIYNRAWSGTREYRLKFTDLLIEHNLIGQCKSYFNPVDEKSGNHYASHDFRNSAWLVKNSLENCFPVSRVGSTASADFDTIDYNETNIEVVLETLFDDDRLHLTEKSLRPIACKQPFILLATHGSLQYLRDYGFQTFDSVWDESYDIIQDPKDRMLAVIDLMNTISNWTPQHRTNQIKKLYEIAEYNHQYFFSDKFIDLVLNEFCCNLSLGIKTVKTNPDFNHWLEYWKENLQHTEIQNFLNTNFDKSHPTIDHYHKILKFITDYPVSGDSKQ
jgi:hypothetical protein